jgi:DNA-binding transcriptional ArsR family regulator
MKRRIAILLVLVAGIALIGGASYFVARSICASQMTRNMDDLSWLEVEFHLSDDQMARIRELHLGYLPKCREYCARIAEKKEELQRHLAQDSAVNPEAQRCMTDIASLRAQCQIQMLTYFDEVSRAMPPEQGRRYLAEMQRLTLGFHDQMEQNMTPHVHEHH